MSYLTSILSNSFHHKVATYKPYLRENFKKILFPESKFFQESDHFFASVW